MWGRTLLDPRAQDESTREAKKFRLRFRVLYAAFMRIVEECKLKRVFPVQREHPNNIAVELKVPLVALRILGQNATADNINELTGLGESTIPLIFKTFCKGMAGSVFPDYVLYMQA